MSTLPDSFIRFKPIYQQRVWGGRMLESRFGRILPEAHLPYGESWEISARPGADSSITEGCFAGQTLSALWEDQVIRKQVFGPDAPETGTFPLLCKILDARETLSLQVHPPHDQAEALGGEAKTEFWYIAHAEPGARLYVGVTPDTSRETFRKAMAEKRIEEHLHSLPVRSGQSLFIPSGRLHAIGSGIVIYEIQQNSDTTYRVYDWERTGLDGQPRELHLEASLQCIDFSDLAPTPDPPPTDNSATLCHCEHFRIELHSLQAGAALAPLLKGRFAIVTVAEGSIGQGSALFAEGDFFLHPHGSSREMLTACEDSRILLTTWGDHV